MKYVAVLPWVYEPYARECLETCQLENLLVIDNSVNNLGVARSWNMGIDRMFRDNADWLIVISAAVRFGDSGGKDFIDHLKHNPNALIVEATKKVYGWHLIAFSRECIHRVGRFDENLSPGYYEDLDYSLRFQRYYNQDFRETPPPNRSWVHVVCDTRDAGMGHSLKYGGVCCDSGRLVDYFKRKWGRHPDQPYEDAYTHPFDDLELPIGFWPATVIDNIPGRWDCPAIPEFIKPDDVEWKKTVINCHHETVCEFNLPWPLCDWDALGNWEHQRFASMRNHLKPGNVLYEIGAEQGWCSLLPASYVGPENMVLVEPSRLQWPNIYLTWQKNFDVQPLACYRGFVGDTTTEVHPEIDWPESSQGPLLTHIAYRHLFDDKEETPQMTLDDLVTHVGKPPDALNIDVEGAELSVLQGAVNTLKTHHPIVWVSVHPDLMDKWYHTTPEQVQELMEECGYRSQLIAEDHEQHFVFHPR